MLINANHFLIGLFTFPIAVSIRHAVDVFQNRQVKTVHGMFQIVWTSLMIYIYVMMISEYGIIDN